MFGFMARRKYTACHGYGVLSRLTVCPDCAGTGEREDSIFPDKRCASCQGTGDKRILVGCHDCQSTGVRPV